MNYIADRGYMDIRDMLVKAFEVEKIKCELLGSEELHSYTKFNFKIASSTRISRQRLDRVEENIERELGFLPKITKQADKLSVEVKNSEPHSISLESVMSKLSDPSLALPIPVGRCGTDDIVVDLAKLPHLLVGGETGYGKTTFLRNAINTISTRENVHLILADNKDHDFSCYEDARWLEKPVIHDFDAFVDAMDYLLDELERRYFLLAQANCRNIEIFNQREGGEKLPYIVFVVADYSEYCNSPLRSELLARFGSKLCAKSKAVGIHLTFSTAAIPYDMFESHFSLGFPARISFRTINSVQSRLMLDTNDACYLYYPGDAYFKVGFESEDIRVQTYC